MLSVGLIWFTFVALGDRFSLGTAFWWSLNWSLNIGLSVNADLRTYATIEIFVKQRSAYMYLQTVMALHQALLYTYFR